MKKINVISHRGANKYAPQNTIAAFEAADKFGVDGFETDVHFTKDGEIVLCHNYSIDETSDGKGELSNLTLQQLKKYDFGSYFSEKFAGTKIPTLNEYLEFIKTTDISVLNIEIKSQKEKNTDIVKLTIDKVKEYGLFDKLLISSFDTDVLINTKKYDENCKTGFLYAPNRNVTPMILSRVVSMTKRQLYADAIHPYYRFVTKRLVETAHENGIQVNPWTVNNVKDINKLIELDVDSFITDLPNVVTGVLSKYY